MSCLSSSANVVSDVFNLIMRRYSLPMYNHCTPCIMRRHRLVGSSFLGLLSYCVFVLPYRQHMKAQTALFFVLKSPFNKHCIAHVNRTLALIGLLFWMCLMTFISLWNERQSGYFNKKEHCTPHIILDSIYIKIILTNHNTLIIRQQYLKH